VTSRHKLRERRASRSAHVTRIASSAGHPRNARAIILDKLRRVSTTPKIALVAGATGLVGGYLINALIEA
jgi:hypothetical protein